VSFLDRTITSLRRGLRNMSGTAYDAVAAGLSPSLPDEDLDALRRQFAETLKERGGEVSARAQAVALGQAYMALNRDGRLRFLTVLATEFDIDEAGVEAAIQARSADQDPQARRAANQALRDALEAPRVKILRRFNGLEEGIKFLVDLRAELLGFVREAPDLKSLEQDLKRLLAGWFDVGLLELRRITWDESSAALLEKLIRYESVHAIESWDDLKNRLDADRRCFAYFHPNMPDEPLIFVEVALVEEMAGDVQGLLDADAPQVDPAQATAAIFYSISNAQTGLAGISFGNALIKRVVADLSREFPDIKTYATLSPIPGFRAWLDDKMSVGDAKLLTAAERKAILEAVGAKRGAKGALKGLVERSDWPADPKAAEALKGPLTRLAARYLYEEKGRDGRARDPVAHFHLSNGARMERLNWLGDTSANGLKSACGLMINYLYRAADIDENTEAYTAQRKIAASSGIRGLL
jgi:malonyl-CoA decarboxylase